MKAEKKAIQGVTVRSILPSTRVGVLALEAGIPMDIQENCPACLAPLTVFCTLASKKHDNTVRIGVCSHCGYMGYMDRPTREWIISFYSKEWDKEFTKSREQMMKDVNMPRNGIKGSRYAAFMLHEKIPVDKEKPFCDIGSGYGQVMKNFANAGWEKVYGVENSEHRAKLVQEVFGFPVVSGDFGSKKVEMELKKCGPFGLLFSHHVFEHVYDPDEVVASMARLQEEGSYLILALPNVSGEHINYTTLYLPHLHGFTKESLEALFNRHGYEVVLDGSPDVINTTLVFKKTSSPKSLFKSGSGYVNEAKLRVKKGLALDMFSSSMPHELVWEQNLTERDTASLLRSKHRGLLAGILWRMRQVRAFLWSRLFQKFTPGYTFLVVPSFEKLTNNEGYEIQFKKSIHLLVK